MQCVCIEITSRTQFCGYNTERRCQCQQKPAISTPTSRLVRIWFIRLAISRSFSIGIGILRSFSANPATRQRKLPFNSLGIFIFLSYLYTCVYSFYSLIKFKFEKKKKKKRVICLCLPLYLQKALQQQSETEV